MDVKAAKFLADGHVIQHPLRQDQAEGSDHHHVSMGVCNSLARTAGVLGVFSIQSQAARLGQGQCMLQRKLFNC